jgi:Pathogenicity locus
MKTANNLQMIPGVGKSLSKDLMDLGYQNVEDLVGEDPENMYQNLCKLRGQHIDRCVLYVFRCAVYYASNSAREPELLKWWNWKDKN